MPNWDWWQQQYAPDLIAAELQFRAELDQADERRDPRYYDAAPAERSAIAPHAGNIVYHCRRCDTHVSISAEELAGRDITKLCLCGQGATVSEDGAPISISPAWPVKPRRAEPTDKVIDQREAAAKAKHKRTEWEEEV